MLEIHYTQDGTNEDIKTYEAAKDFVAAQYKEVPDLQDNFKVKKVLIDGKELQLTDATIGGLFNELNQ